MGKAERLKAYEKGTQLEKLAAFYLRLKGYRILKLRYKTPFGEIDIIGRRENSIIFVEVKGRGEMESALSAVNLRNRLRVEQAARFFVASHPQFAASDMRFDVVAFAPPFRFVHLDNAWRPRS